MTRRRKTKPNDSRGGPRLMKQDPPIRIQQQPARTYEKAEAMIELSDVLLLALECTTSLQTALVAPSQLSPILDGGCEVAAVLTDHCYPVSHGLRVWCWRSD